MGKLSDAERTEIENRIKALDMQQYAIKIIINSLYGAFGNSYFYFYDPDIAQSITVQGRDLIKFSIKALNHYAMNKWHLDTELHEKLGLFGYKINKIDTEVTIYCDTDSSYVNFLPFALSIEGKKYTGKEAIELVKSIIEYRIANYLDSAFEKYAESHNTVNQMDFKLENISYSGIWTGKKHYTLKVAFEDGFFLAKPKLKATGIDMAKPSLPVWSRDRQREIIDVMLDKGYSISHEKDIIPRLVEMRKSFNLLDIEQTHFNHNVRVYDKYVETDKELVIPKGMPIGARAALYHNHMIELTHNLKYQKIREGDKVKFYYAKHPDNPEMNVFAYGAGNYPAEFAFPMDYDEQFFALVTDPINKLLEAMNLQQITSGFKREIKYNMPKSKKILKPSDIYPLYIINNETLEYVEFPSHLVQYFMRQDLAVPEELFEEYVGCISTYKINTEIVPKFQLEKYIKNKRGLMAKREARGAMKQLSEDVREMFDEAVAALKTLKIKYSIDDATCLPTFTHGKTKKSVSITMEQIETFDVSEEIVGFVKGNVLVEEKNEDV